TQMRTFQMKLINQEDITGCGVACLAMVSGTSYAQAKQAIFKNRMPKKLYTFWPQLRRGMDRLGVGYEDRVHRTAKLTSIKRRAIVGCGEGPRTIDSHWVVYDPRTRLVYDPWRTYKSPVPASDFERPVYSYLHVR